MECVVCKVRVNKLPEHLQSHTKQQIVNALLRSEQSNAVHSLQSGVGSLQQSTSSRGVLGRHNSGGSSRLNSGVSGGLSSGASGGPNGEPVAGPSFISSNKSGTNDNRFSHSNQPSSLASISRIEPSLTGGVTSSSIQIAPSLSRSVHTEQASPNHLIRSGQPVVASHTSRQGVQVVPTSLVRSGTILAPSSLYRNVASMAPIHVSRNEASSAPSQLNRIGGNDAPCDISRSGVHIAPRQLSRSGVQVAPSDMSRSGVQIVPSNMIRSGVQLVSSNMTRTTVSVAPSFMSRSGVPVTSNQMSRNGVPTNPGGNVILNSGPTVSYAVNRQGDASIAGLPIAATLGSGMAPAGSGLSVSSVTGTLGSTSLEGGVAAVNIQRTMNNVHIVNNIGNAQLIAAAGNPAAFSAGYGHQIPGFGGALITNPAMLSNVMMLGGFMPANANGGQPHAATAIPMLNAAAGTPILMPQINGPTLLLNIPAAMGHNNLIATSTGFPFLQQQFVALNPLQQQLNQQQNLLFQQQQNLLNQQQQNLQHQLHVPSTVAMVGSTACNISSVQQQQQTTTSTTSASVLPPVSSRSQFVPSLPQAHEDGGEVLGGGVPVILQRASSSSAHKFRRRSLDGTRSIHDPVEDRHKQMHLSVDNDDDVLDKEDISDDVIKVGDMDDESDDTGTDTDSMMIMDEHIVDPDDPKFEHFEEPPVLQPAVLQPPVLQPAAPLSSAHHQLTSTCPVLSASAIASSAMQLPILAAKLAASTASPGTALSATLLATPQLTSSDASVPVAPFKVSTTTVSSSSRREFGAPYKISIPPSPSPASPSLNIADSGRVRVPSVELMDEAIPGTSRDTTGSSHGTGSLSHKELRDSSSRSRNSNKQYVISEVDSSNVIRLSHKFSEEAVSIDEDDDTIDMNDSIDLDVVSDYSSDEEPHMISYRDQGPSTSNRQPTKTNEDQLFRTRGFNEVSSLNSRKLQDSRRHESSLSNNSLNYPSSSSFRPVAGSSRSSGGIRTLGPFPGISTASQEPPMLSSNRFTSSARFSQQNADLNRETSSSVIVSPNSMSQTSEPVEINCQSSSSSKSLASILSTSATLQSSSFMAPIVSGSSLNQPIAGKSAVSQVQSINHAQSNNNIQSMNNSSDVSARNSPGIEQHDFTDGHVRSPLTIHTVEELQSALACDKNVQLVVSNELLDTPEFRALIQNMQETNIPDDIISESCDGTQSTTIAASIMGSEDTRSIPGPISSIEVSRETTRDGFDQQFDAIESIQLTSSNTRESADRSAGGGREQLEVGEEQVEVGGEQAGVYILPTASEDDITLQDLIAVESIEDSQMSDDVAIWPGHLESRDQLQVRGHLGAGSQLETGGHMSGRSQPLAGGSQVAPANRNINTFAGGLSVAGSSKSDSHQIQAINHGASQSSSGQGQVQGHGQGQGEDAAGQSCEECGVRLSSWMERKSHLCKEMKIDLAMNLFGSNEEHLGDTYLVSKVDTAELSALQDEDNNNALDLSASATASIPSSSKHTAAASSCRIPTTAGNRSSSKPITASNNNSLTVAAGTPDDKMVYINEDQSDDQDDEDIDVDSDDLSDDADDVIGVVRMEEEDEHDTATTSDEGGVDESSGEDRSALLEILVKKEDNKADNSFTVANQDPLAMPGNHWKCQQCKLIFPNSASLYKHCERFLSNLGGNVDDNGDIKCNPCHLIFEERSGLLTHVKMKHKNHNLPDNISVFDAITTTTGRGIIAQNPIQLKMPMKIEETDFDSKLFMQNSNGEYTCNLCDRAFKVAVRLKKHLACHHQEKPFECLQCGKRYPKLLLLKRHMMIHTEKKSFQCTLCYKGFYNMTKLREHMRIHTGETPLHCEICNKGFRRHSNLSSHRKIHDPNREPKPKKEIFCKDCGQMFTTKRDLEWHNEKTHNKVPNKCKDCGEVFVHSRSLTRHMRLKHDNYFVPKEKKGSNYAKCPICDALFYKTSINKHIKVVHHNIRQFQCDICMKSFVSKHNLDTHVWQHKAKRSRPWKCTKCNKAYLREALLKEHMNSHKINKPYVCNECGVQFSMRHNWKRHVEEHEGKRTFNCPECNKTFSRSYYLSDHLKVHSGEKPYLCGICGKTTATRSNYNSHLKTHATREPVNSEV